MFLYCWIKNEVFRLDENQLKVLKLSSTTLYKDEKAINETIQDIIYPRTSAIVVKLIEK